MKKFKKLPRFKTENEERDFWKTHDSTDYFDWSKAKRATVSHLKPSTKIISIRLPEHLLNRIKIAAHKRDVPYQTFIKLLLDQTLQSIK